ncbi:MAG: hypothetical protein ABI047_03190 [Jatrophihabitantaceae bacterium]
MSKGQRGKKAGKGKRPPAGHGPRVTPAAADPQDTAYSDRLIAEVADLGDHLVVPANAPVMMAFHQLNRRRRAQLTAALRRLQPRTEKFDQEVRAALSAVKELQPGEAPTEATLEAGEELFEFLADVEDLLALVAFEPESFHRWANLPTTKDEDLLALFSRFSRSMNQGEASSSSI